MKKDKILTASDKFKSVSRMLDVFSRSCRIRLPADRYRYQGDPVAARVNLGRWLADCECGGAELVDPTDNRFFCFSCGNAMTGGSMRAVIFPEDRDEIERELILRGGRKIGDIVHPLPGGLPREWIPTETASTLRDQRLSIEV